MFCSQCGKPAEEGAHFCTGCGMRFQNPATANNPGQKYGEDGQYAGGAYGTGGQYYGTRPPNPNDRPSFWWGVFGFFFSGWLAIILYVVWRAEYPKRAASILKGFIIGIIFWVIFVVVLVSTGVFDGLYEIVFSPKA